MAKISGKYEIVYIIDPAQGEELPTSLLTSGASVVSLTRSTTRPKAIMS